MSSAPSFAPRWASPPGETIREALTDRELTQDSFASMLGWNVERTSQLLDGDEAISLDLARRLVRIVGGSVQFWMSRDAQYRDDLSRVEGDAWAQTLPDKDMRAFGWLPQTESWQEKLTACLDFFDVPDVHEWRSSYGSQIADARFRTSPTVRTSEAAVATWLRQADIQARDLPVADWNPERFRMALDEARALTFERDPRIFIPQLRELCGSAGVVLIVLRAPNGCPVSGVARINKSGARMIVLSGRYLSDDHLWFTFFHEAAHLLLHDATSMYVDEFENSSVTEVKSRAESEADEFAHEFLYPEELRLHLSAPRSIRDVIRHSKKAGVSPGVLVGQLQHAGTIGFNRMNGVKRRYRWVGTTLEMA